MPSISWKIKLRPQILTTIDLHRGTFPPNSHLLGMDVHQEAVVSLPSGFRMPGKPEISKSQILPARTG
jgi:hypothetical protein